MKRIVISTLAAAVFSMPFALAKPPAKAPTKPAPTKAAKPAPKPTPEPLRTPVHPGPMWSVAFSPDGNKLAVGGYRKIFLYDGLTGAKTAEYPVSSDAIRSLAFSADGNLLAVGTGVPGQSGTALVLEATTGKVIRMIKSHTDTVEAVAFSGNLLLAAADDERVSVTDVTTGQQVGKLSEHIGRCLSVAVPKETAPDAGGEIFATGGADDMVKIWDAKARRVVVNFDQCQSPVWCLTALPRAGLFLAGSGDGNLRMFRVRADGGKGGVAENIPARAGALQRTMPGHEGGVYAVAASADGRWLVSGGADRKMVLWRGTGDRMKEFTEATGDIWGVALSPDGKRAAAASLDGHTRIYDIEKNTLLFTLDAKGLVNTPPPAAPAPPAPAKPTPTPARVSNGTLK